MTNTVLPRVTKTLDRIEGALPPVASHLFALNRAVYATGFGVAERIASSVGISSDRVANQMKDSKNTVTGTIKRETKDAAAALRDEVTSTLDEATERVEASNPATDYESMTKAELYEIAQELDVENRSQMNKKQLIKALESV